MTTCTENNYSTFFILFILLIPVSQNFSDTGTITQLIQSIAVCLTLKHVPSNSITGHAKSQYFHIHNSGISLFSIRANFGSNRRILAPKLSTPKLALINPSGICGRRPKLVKWTQHVAHTTDGIQKE